MSKLALTGHQPVPAPKLCPGTAWRNDGKKGSNSHHRSLYLVSHSRLALENWGQHFPNIPLAAWTFILQVSITRTFLLQVSIKTRVTLFPYLYK